VVTVDEWGRLLAALSPDAAPAAWKHNSIPVAHIDVPGVENHLIATEAEYRRHLASWPEYHVDGHIEGRITHLGEMSSPEVRAIIWAKVQEVSEALQRGEIGDKPA
jgi:hypothetical protein